MRKHDREGFLKNKSTVVLSIVLLGLGALSFGQTATKVEKVKRVAPAEFKSPVVDGAQLTSARTHLKEALKAMQVAMPIYNGHRGMAISPVHQALVAIEKVINVAPPEKPKAAAKEVAKAAPVVQKTQEEKIADSQANMAKGQTELEAAAKDLENARTWNQTEEGAKAVKLIQTAIEEAKASIKYVATGK